MKKSFFKRVGDYFGCLKGNARVCIAFHPLWGVPYTFYTYYISLYLQDLLSQEDSDIDDEDDLWFMPTYSYYNSNTGTTYYYADNYFYTQTTLNGTSALRHPVLKLTYSVLK